MRINAGWPAVHGRPNILAVPIAGSLTLRQGSSIQTSIPAVSAVRFAGAKSTCGPAITIFSIGKSIRRSRPSLGKGGGDQKSPTWSPAPNHDLEAVFTVRHLSVPTQTAPSRLLLLAAA